MTTHASSNVVRRRSAGIGQRIAVALLIFVTLFAMSVFLPASIPGEMRRGDLTPHAAARCASCPPTERLAAAGVEANADGWAVNLEFEAPPVNSAVRITMAGLDRAIALRQAGAEWRFDGPPSAPAPLRSVFQRGTRIVFTIPADVRTSGFAIATGAGDRIPESGFLEPRYAAAAHFNATDAVVLAILLATAVIGYRRGLVTEVVNLAAIAASVVVAAVLYRPLAGAFLRVVHSSVAASAIASGLLVTVAAIAGTLILPRMAEGWRTNAGSVPLGGVMGGAAGVLRQLAVLAMLLTVGVEVALLRWASGSIHSSLIGSALLQGWRTIFHP